MIVDNRTDDTRITPPTMEKAPTPKGLTAPEQEQKVELDPRVDSRNKLRRARVNAPEAKIITGMPYKELTNIQHVKKNFRQRVEFAGGKTKEHVTADKRGARRGVGELEGLEPKHCVPVGRKKTGEKDTRGPCHRSSLDQPNSQSR